MSKIESLLSELINEVDYELSAGRLELSESISTFLSSGTESAKDGDYIIPESVIAPSVRKGQFYNRMKEVLCALQISYADHLLPTDPIPTPVIDSYEGIKVLKKEEIFNSPTEVEERLPVPHIPMTTPEPVEKAKKKTGVNTWTRAVEAEFTGGERMREMVLCAMWVELHKNGFCGGGPREVQEATEKFMRDVNLLKKGDMEQLRVSPTSTYTAPRVWRQAYNALSVLVGTGYVKKMPDKNYYLTDKGKQEAKELLKGRK